MAIHAILIAGLAPMLALSLGGAVDTDLSGKLGTLGHGRWICELPGDATGQAVRPIEGEWFEVINNSSYRNKDGHGTYLLSGKSVRFTRGPMLGARFTQTSSNALRQLDADGKPTPVRCVRTILTN